MTAPAPVPTLREAWPVWLRIGLLGFGGPAGQIALMHRELVERRGWIDERRFLQALNVCMLLPGPEAHQLSVYVGWLLHRTKGAVIAGVLFVLPGAAMLWALSWLYVTHGHNAAVSAAFAGLRPALVAVIAAALWRVGRTAVRTVPQALLAGGAFLALAFADVAFPWVIGAAALVGALSGGSRSARASSGEAAEAAEGAPALPRGEASSGPASEPLSGWGTVRTAVRWTALWLAPIAGLVLVLGPEHVLTLQARIFSPVSLVTFGGAYAVLPYVAHHAVDTHGWLTAGQMLDGLALAETKPGPLVLVLQFVGFLGAWSSPAPFAPLAAATLGSAVTVWSTFVPSFLFILTIAPHMERLNQRPRIAKALASVTAAVAGVILSLAVWFGREVGWPDGRADLWAIGLSVAAGVVLTRTRVGLPWVLAACALAGWVRYALAG
ncbi:MAG: chromate efflux transporter [Verrucomicrobia bacterium]|nr:chromate efflux transporter [Verrucomicrobiota bacterium]